MNDRDRGWATLENPDIPDPLRGMMLADAVSYNAYLVAWWRELVRLDARQLRRVRERDQSAATNREIVATWERLLREAWQIYRERQAWLREARERQVRAAGEARRG